MRDAAEAAELGDWREREMVLALAGGAALGAYHLGAAERLWRSGFAPDWLVGASIGAVTAAILAGAPGPEGLSRLRAFWARGAWPPPPALPHELALTRPRDSDDRALAAVIYGRPGLFGPRLPGGWSALPWLPGDVALRDHGALAQTLDRLVDFDRLNSGEPRVSMVALDIETGEEVWFDNRADRITARHLLACTGLAPLFPPVEIDGRLLCDAGFANNLPLDRVFAEPPARDMLCVAVDLFPLRRPRPRSISETLARAADLAFASQTRRAVERVARDLAARPADQPAATLALMADRGGPSELAGKALDFSAGAVKARVARGRADADGLIARLSALDPRRGPALV